MANDYTTRESIDSEYSLLLDRIIEKAGYYDDVSDYINKELKEIDQETIIDKAAFLWTYEKLGSNIEEIVINAVITACVNSGEFNYDLYIDQFIKAIQYHFFEIIQLQPIEGVSDINVYINFESLGSIDMWASAIDAVRTEKGWGATRGITEWEGSEDSDDMDLASHLWREKIYAVDREGGKVFKNKKVRDEEGKEKTESVDVTENYVGKYRNTIELRLAAIPENTAPFWELIEYGNAIMEGGDGSPYPIIEPSRFKELIETRILQSFYKIYNQLRDKVTKWFGDNILKEFGFKGRTHGAELLDEVSDWVYDEIVKELGNLSKELVEQANPGKTLVAIDYISGQYEVYKTTIGKLGVRRRGPSGFEALFGS